MRIEFLGSIVLKNLYLLILFNLYLFIDWSGNPLFLTNLSRGSNINLNLLIRIFPGFQEDWLFPEIAQFRYKTSMRSRVEKGESFSRYDNPKKGNHIWNTFRKNKLILCNPLPNIKIERKFSFFLLFSPPFVPSHDVDRDVEPLSLGGRGEMEVFQGIAERSKLKFDAALRRTQWERVATESPLSSRTTQHFHLCSILRPPRFPNYEPNPLSSSLGRTLLCAAPSVDASSNDDPRLY